jgi:hypothetical protein
METPPQSNPSSKRPKLPETTYEADAEAAAAKGDLPALFAIFSSFGGGGVISEHRQGAHVTMALKHLLDRGGAAAVLTATLSQLAFVNSQLALATQLKICHKMGSKMLVAGTSLSIDDFTSSELDRWLRVSQACIQSAESITRILIRLKRLERRPQISPSGCKNSPSTGPVDAASCQEEGVFHG